MILMRLGPDNIRGGRPPRNRELMLADIVPCRELVTVPSAAAFMSGRRGGPQLIKGTMEDHRICDLVVTVERIGPPHRDDWKITAEGRISETDAQRLYMLQVAIDRATGRGGML